MNICCIQISMRYYSLCSRHGYRFSLIDFQNVINEVNLSVQVNV